MTKDLAEHSKARFQVILNQIGLLLFIVKRMKHIHHLIYLHKHSIQCASTVD